MKNKKDKKDLRTDEEMLKKILLNKCGNRDTDEYAADELELKSRRENAEFADDNPEIGESEYFSTCEYKMVNEDDDLIDFQGS